MVCLMLVTTSTVILIKPENLDVKADSGGGGNGNEVGINVTYIQTIAQNLSSIVITNPKGRSYGTPGEGVAARYIKNWMEEIGLYNVHNESITYGFNKTGSPKAIDKKVEDLSSKD